MKRYLGAVCAAFLIVLLVLAIFPSLIAKYSYAEQNSEALLLAPSATHLLGTDELGRDLLARLLYGARISLACALLATLLSAIIGVSYGSLSGFLGGAWDQLMMRFLDILYSVPDLLIFILLGLFLGRDFLGLLVALSALGWVTTARITRGEVLKVKQWPFVEAGRALGLPRSRLLIQHILPQVRDPVLVTLILKIPAIILAESTLSFIGLGLSPPYASWGTLASEGYSALRFYPHLIVYPSLFIFLTIFSFQIVGRSLSEQTRKMP